MRTQNSELRKLLSIKKQEYDIRAEIERTCKPDAYFQPKLKLLQVERNEICKKLETKLLTLTPVEYKIFQLRYLYGKLPRQIAKKLSYSLSAIQHKLTNINRKLSAENS